MTRRQHGRDGIADEHDRTAWNRRTALRALALAGLVGVGSGTAAAGSRDAVGGSPPLSAGAGAAFPEVLPLPTGFRPEGIVTGRGHAFYVGSLATGEIYRGDLRTGAGAVLPSAPAGAPAVGLSHDRRSDHLFVAGGGSGEAYVYDGQTGATEAVYALTPPGSFVNDVVVTREAAYFTDSFRAFLYELPLGPRGRLPAPAAVSELPLGGDFVQVGGFNANGIDAPPDAEFLLVVNSTTGDLFRVDPASGDASLIDLGGATLTSGDGILLDGRTLYVLRNFLNEIVVIELDPGATAGTVVGSITDPRFDVPTTLAEFGNALYAVNARFGNPDPGTATYDAIRVSKQPDD